MVWQVKPRVYVAGPLSKGDQVENIRRAVHYANLLLDAGCAPFVPHLSHLWHLITPKPYEEWLEIDLEWVAACHAVLRIQGESTGADREVAFAKAAGIPVFHTIEELVVWRAKWSAG